MRKGSKNPGIADEAAAAHLLAADLELRLHEE